MTKKQKSLKELLAEKRGVKKGEIKDVKDAYDDLGYGCEVDGYEDEYWATIWNGEDKEALTCFVQPHRENKDKLYYTVTHFNYPALTRIDHGEIRKILREIKYKPDYVKYPMRVFESTPQIFTTIEKAVATAHGLDRTNIGSEETPLDAALFIASHGSSMGGRQIDSKTVSKHDKKTLIKNQNLEYEKDEIAEFLIDEFLEKYGKKKEVKDKLFYPNH